MVFVNEKLNSGKTIRYGLFLTCPEVELTTHASSSSSRTAESLAYPSCLSLFLCKLLSSPITRFPVSCRQSFPGFLSSLLAASFNCCCLSQDNLPTAGRGKWNSAISPGELSRSSTRSIKGIRDDFKTIEPDLFLWKDKSFPKRRAGCSVTCRGSRLFSFCKSWFLAFLTSYGRLELLAEQMKTREATFLMEHETRESSNKASLETATRTSPRHGSSRKTAGTRTSYHDRSWIITSWSMRSPQAIDFMPVFRSRVCRS